MSSTIGDLKRRAIAELFGEGRSASGSYSFFHLVRGGSVLEDSARLGDSGVRDGDILTFVAKAATVLATGHLDGSVRILDTVTRHEHCWRYGDRVAGVAWSSSGKELAVASGFGDGGEGCGRVTVYETATGDPKGEVYPLDGPATAVAWAPSNDIAAAEMDNITLLSDGSAARKLPSIRNFAATVASIRLGRAFVTSIAWCPDGRRLAVGLGGYCACGGVAILEIETGPQTGRVLWTWDAWRTVHDVAWSLDGQHLAAASGDHRSELGDVTVLRADAEGAVERSWRLSMAARSVSWSPGGRRLAALGCHRVQDSGSVHTFALDGARDRPDRSWDLKSRCSRLSWSPDDQLLAVASEDGSLRVIRAGLSGQTDDVEDSDVQSFTSGAEEEDVSRWNFSPWAVNCMAWSPA